MSRMNPFSLIQLLKEHYSNRRAFLKQAGFTALTGGLLGGALDLQGTTAAHADSPVASYQQNADGVTFTLQAGVMQLNVYDSIVHVRYSVQSSIPSGNSLIITESWPAQTNFTVNSTDDTVVITTSTLNIVVNKGTGSITYQDLQNTTLLAEDPTSAKTITATTVNGLSTNTLQTAFDSPPSEAFYGLGNHQDFLMNYKGNNEVLDQQNAGGTGASIAIPFLLSTRGYALLWDTYAKSWFYGGNGSDTPASQFRFQIEAGDTIDYYFIYGPSFDQIISSYRVMTGQAPLFPKWAYGLFQSYEHYASRDELTTVVDSYRNNKIPLDVIVQDWRYWDPDVWGSHTMDPGRYPDPAQMLTNFHNQHVYGMISVWAYFAAGSNNYNELVNNGVLYTNEGNYYDAYSSTGRSIYWRQLRDELFNNYGWDAWWLDSSEWDPGFPTCCFDRHAVQTASGPGSIYYNAYPLEHTTAVYSGQRATTSARRVFILTRSAYAGQQRNAAAAWSGDISSDWNSFARQIPAGLNFSLSGIPYWNTDIGGFQGTDWTTEASNELFTRWLQFGAFCPIFRIHGEGHREIYGSQWTATTQANLRKMNNLRYRLLPYIYSLAALVTNSSYTIMRPLVMDYQSDTNVTSIGDQYMFGPAFLVSPVTQQGASNRSLYLPAGSWYDFWTGISLNGSQTITANAPLDKIPLYIKAGSIVPLGPNIQYATQSVDPLEIRVYRGVSGSFTLYEDEGDNYNYEQGKSASIPFYYDDGAGTLTIGALTGGFDGMLTSRTFNIVWVGQGYGTGVEETVNAQSVTYTGALLSVNVASAPSTVRYEAEYAALSGGAQLATDHGGYTGTSFVAGFVNGGAGCAFSVTVASSGSFTVTLRYSNGPDGPSDNGTKTVNVYVNGTKIQQVSLPTTTTWETWSTVDTTLSLNAGSNTISYQYDGDDTGWINLDNITISS